MCGIVGYVGRRQARDLLLAGLQKLEYRGYDSAGISVLSGDALESVRAVGNLANLQAAVAEQEQLAVGAGATLAAAASATRVGPPTAA
jgi:glutamine---fructose-6-phosphate transaminase (isomerizing)